MKTFYIRTFSGFVYAVVILGGILAGPVVFGLLLGVVLILGLIELGRIFKKVDLLPGQFNLYFFPVTFYVLGYLYVVSILPIHFLVLGGPLVLLALLVEMLRSGPHPVGRGASLVLSVLYLSLPLLMLNLLFFDWSTFDAPKGFLVFSVFLIVWINDTFAYLAGSLIGKTQLTPISPKKTWEGSIGGLVFSIAGAVALYYLFGQIALWEWIGMALLIVVFGTLGDLFESALKRSAGIKESGNILPGHGGILDRFDSILIAGPMVFAFIYIIMKQYAV